MQRFSYVQYVSGNEANLVSLPDDSEALKAMLRMVMNERDKQSQLAGEQTRRANDLQVEILRLQLEVRTSGKAGGFLR